MLGDRPVLAQRGDRRAHQPAELSLTKLAPSRAELDAEGSVRATVVNTGSAGIGVRVHVWGRAIASGLITPLHAVLGDTTLPLAPMPSEAGDVLWFAADPQQSLPAGELVAHIHYRGAAVGAGQLQLAIFAAGQRRPPSYKTQVSVASTDTFRPPPALAAGLAARLRAMGGDPAALDGLLDGPGDS